jgi:GNAT superfamily N-acetyltransferase
MQLRTATSDDAVAVAALHADSWKRHYRGAYSNEYLDGDVFAERRAVWAERLAHTDPDAARTILAVEGDSLLGFAHVIFDDDPTWGALLDNLHVTFDHKRGGIGTQLMAASAHAVIERPERTGLYLWALEMNAAGRAFYRALGGREAGEEPSDLEGGGTAIAVRYSWPDPAVLVNRGVARPA